MDPITGAIVTGGLVQAGSSIWGGLLQSNAANQAAAASGNAAMRAEMGLTSARAEAIGLLSPYDQTGQSARRTLMTRLLGPQAVLKQLQTQRSKLAENVNRLGTQTDLASLPLLTGPMASERWATLYQQKEAERVEQLRQTESELRALDQEIAGFDVNAKDPSLSLVDPRSVGKIQGSLMGTDVSPATWPDCTK